MGKYMLNIEGSCFFHRDIFVAWNKYCRLRATLVRDSEYGIEALSYWQLNNEVKCDCFKRHGFLFGIYWL
jgi:hypothetical protein